jgi:hypothetical protein
MVVNKQEIDSQDTNNQSLDTFNRSTGLDFAFRPWDSLDIRGLWARTFGSTFEEDDPDEENASENSNAFYIGSNWQSDSLRLGASYTDIGESFNPEVGFIRREDIRQVRANAGYNIWPRKFGIRSIDFGTDFDVVYTRDNDLETRDISLDSDFELETGGSFDFQVRHTEDQLKEDFEIREGVFIPIGDYNFTDFRASFRSDGNRKISGRLSGDFGDFYNGEKWGLGIDAGIKPNARLSVDAMFDFNRVILPQEAFNASIFGSRISYSFSTKLFTKLFAQWNSEADEFSTNMLINYIYRPGSDFYLVVNQRYGTADEFDHQETTVVAKITYWWNP